MKHSHFYHITGEVDEMSSPSGRIIVGAPVKAGTGQFELVTPLPKQE
jgi:hypothetical protein